MIVISKNRVLGGVGSWVVSIYIYIYIYIEADVYLFILDWWLMYISY